MNETVVNIALLIISIVFGALFTYFKTNAKLKGKVGEYISDAENLYASSTKAGGEKFEWVVDQLYNLIPAILKPIFTRVMISTIVQSAFDTIQNYAKTQLDKHLTPKG